MADQMFLLSRPADQIFSTSDSRFALVRRPGSEMPTLVGYAIVWNVLSGDRGGYVVRLLPGSAKFTDPTRALYHHDFSNPLGRTDRQTLRILPDDYGVKVEIDLPATQCGRDVAVLVDRGDVAGMSFGMLKPPSGPKTREGGLTVVNVSAFDCDEVTVTGLPAFIETTIAIKETESRGLATAPARAYSVNNSQRLKLNRLRLSSLRLPAAEFRGNDR